MRRDYPMHLKAGLDAGPALVLMGAITILTPSKATSTCVRYHWIASCPNSNIKTA